MRLAISMLVFASIAFGQADWINQLKNKPFLDPRTYLRGSTTGGLQEAICALPSIGGTVYVSSNIALAADVNSCLKTSVGITKLAGTTITGAHTILGVSSDGGATQENFNSSYSIVGNALLGANAAFARTQMNTYWSPGPVHYNTFGIVNPSDSGSPGVPTFGVSSWIQQNNGNGNDAVAVEPICIAGVDGAHCFGINIVIGNNPTVSKPGGSVNPGQVGIETDFQGYSTPASGSYAYTAVEYNVANPLGGVMLCRNGAYAVTPPAWGYCINSEDGSTGVSLYSGSLGIPGATNVTSQHIQFHSNSGGTDHIGEIFADVNGKATLDFTGFAGNGTAVKTAAPSACTITSGVALSTCNTTVTWGSPFADTNYVTSCSLTAATGTPFIVNEQSSTTATSAVVQIANLTTANTSGQLYCIGFHL